MNDSEPSKKIRLRVGTRDEIPELRKLFRETVLNVNVRDYSQEEVEDWASCGGRPGRMEELFEELHFIVAYGEEDGSTLGFASIRSDGYLHSLFVHKDRQGEGIGTALLRQAEEHAMEHGAKEIHSEVSITARPFFEGKGYVVELEQKARANRLYLTNYRMRKIL